MIRTRTAIFLLFLPLVMTGFFACSPDLEISRKFQEAQKIFNNASSPHEFLQSAALYGQIINAGFVSGTVFYNMGNAFMQADKRGLAIAAYRQAQRYDPRNPFLRPNLEFAFQNPAALFKRQSIIDHLFFWKDWLSYHEKYLLTTTLAGLCLVFALLSLFFNSRTAWKRMRTIFLIITVLFGLSAAYDWYRFDLVQHGVVIQEEVTARKGTSESFQPAFTEKLQETTEFTLKEERDQWILIRLENGLEGWIPLDDAKIF